MNEEGTSGISTTSKALNKEREENVFDKEKGRERKKKRDLKLTRKRNRNGEETNTKPKA